MVSHDQRSHSDFTLAISGSFTKPAKLCVRKLKCTFKMSCNPRTLSHIQIHIKVKVRIYYWYQVRSTCACKYLPSINAYQINVFERTSKSKLARYFGRTGEFSCKFLHFRCFESAIQKKNSYLQKRKSNFQHNTLITVSTILLTQASDYRSAPFISTDHTSQDLMTNIRLRIL